MRDDRFDGREQIGGYRITRRRLLQFCGAMAATLPLPLRYSERIAEALTSAPRPPLVWLEFQDCTGDTESFLRAGNPTIDDLLLQAISLNYHETIMVPAGVASERPLFDTVRSQRGQYICLIEGSIPAGSGGIFCTIRGRTALSIAQEVARDALAVIAVGTCACDGGLAAAAPNPTGALGVRRAIPGLANLVALPGCPANVENITATLVHYLTFGALPACDGEGRPRFAYGDKVHANCERRDHYEHHRFVLEWGDAGHRAGWCLKKMGCKGPDTRHNCPVVKWNQASSWPVGAGHGCVGCATAGFWDRLVPFYVQLSDDA